MKHVYCFFLVLLTAILTAGQAFSANELFRSISTGNWNSTLTWEMSTNGGGSWFAATSVPHDTSGAITVRSPNTVTVTVSTTSNQLTIDGGGTLTVNSGIVLTTPNGTGNEVTVSPAGIVNGTGTIRTQGAGVGINLRAGSVFSAQLRINTGTADVYDQSSPNDGFLYGNLIIDSGATVQGGPATGISLTMYGNVINNGTLTATSAGGELRMKGPSIINNGTIPVGGHFHFDSTTTISGTGSYNGVNQWINANANITLASDVTFAPSANLTMQTGGVLNINGFVMTFNAGSFFLNAGNTVNGPGTVRTQNNVGIYPGNSSLFNADINVDNGFLTSGTTSVDRIFGNVTVDNGASYNCGFSTGRTTTFYGSILNNGTIYTSSVGGIVRIKGSSLVNNGSVAVTGNFYFDTTTAISGTGIFSSANQWISANGNVTLMSNVTITPSAGLTLLTGAVLNINNYILTYNSGTFVAQTGTFVNAPGTVRTQNDIGFYPVNGSTFKADLKVNTGTTFTGNSGPGDRYYGSVTVDNGASMNCGANSGRVTNIHGNITNNGTLNATSTNGHIIMKGASLVNSGAINAGGNFYFDTVTSVSGNGSFTISNQYITPNGNVTLLSDVTIAPTTGLTMQTGGVLNVNGFVMTYSSGTFTLNAGNTVNGPGTVRTQNDVAIYTGNSSAFNADIKVNTGSLTTGTTAVDRIFGNVTIDNGASYNCGWSSGRRTDFYGTITNNGTLYASSIAGHIRIKGPSLINNGTVNLASSNCYFDTTTVLSGTGSFNSHFNLAGNANVTLNSTHQILSMTKNTGTTFTITGRLLKATGSNPITGSGTFNNSGSTIEYNGTSSQMISTGFNYAGLKINNSTGAYLPGVVTVNDTISVVLGDLDLNGYVITLSSSGYLTETPGNTIKGTAGYITTTRSLNAPGSMNVGGLGAVLTSSANLGSTEIRRGHAVQSGPFLGTSIQRYFDITPANNSGLNATLRFKYDESEIGGSNENLLTLYSSINAGTNWTSRGGAPDPANNQITINNLNSFSRWTANASGFNAVIGLGIQGFYNPTTNRMNQKDTIRVYLRNASAPYNIVDSAKNTIDSVLLAVQLVFPNITPGTYYIQLKHRNSIETWSKAGGETYSAFTTLNYDFTPSAASAYGSNQISIDASPVRFGIYSGDVDQNGVVNLTDVLLTFNASTSFTTGYKNTDLNGDNIVNLSDVTIGYNNASNFVSKMTP